MIKEGTVKHWETHYTVNQFLFSYIQGVQCKEGLNLKKARISKKMIILV